MKPLLAHTYEPKRMDPLRGTDIDVWLQPKLNGVRALYQAGHFQSRDEIPWPKDMLKHLTQPLQLMFPDERTVLDGELYVHGWPLQRINQAVAVNATVRGANEDTPFVEYHIFDRVSYELPFEERFFNFMLQKNGLFVPEIKVRKVETIRCNDTTLAEDFYAIQVSKHYEGIMYRIGDCPYTRPKEETHTRHVQNLKVRTRYLSDKNNRVWHMLKRKDWQDDEFTCVRVEEGEGKRSNMVGAIICETSRGQYFGVGSGLTEEECIRYYENPPIGRKIKVKFLCYTSDGIPFNPVVLAVL